MSKVNSTTQFLCQKRHLSNFHGKTDFLTEIVSIYTFLDFVDGCILLDLKSNIEQKSI